ncbi:hypothetical protein EC973_000815 [Apophysomyces ossiformis]|uniref:Enoyl reductase (ER) domain-containing protein n=1 Tax=Apophysomyces ossiformis TaxID=679940 RepID=A0A8H7BKQ0_9FUNG|nr:hypothetical protein EC973_000815 [Apophysomyces ossiformis]
MSAIVIAETSGSESDFKFDVKLQKHQVKELEAGESLVKIHAAALNHRDIWIMKGQYPGPSPVGSVLAADGVGTVVKNGSTAAVEVGQRVLINPGRGWDSDEREPERTFSILGTLAESVTIESKELVPCPDHLSNTEAAALPLVGLTAFRAVFTKAQVKKGDHVLVTGIGGGVAITALQFAIAAGAHVYVTSSSPEKIQRAVSLGAKGGVSYKDENFVAELKKLLGDNLLSAIIDGSGGPLYQQYPDVLRNGGIIVNYGQTAGIAPFNRSAFIKNIELRGSTMGSRREFQEMVTFVKERQIKPIVSQVWHGLSEKSVKEALQVMNQGQQFGKLVIEVDNN